MPKTDPARAILDKKLMNMESKIRGVYSEALETVKKRANDYLAGYERLDKRNKNLLKAGEISRAEYLKRREDAIMQGTGWIGLRETIVKDLVNSEKIAASIINGFLPEAYAESVNFATYEVELGTGIKTSFSLYNKEAVEAIMKKDKKVIPAVRLDIPKSKRWGREKIASALAQGIIAGDSIPHIAKRLEQVTTMDEKAAIRNARTWTTAAEGKGRYDAYRRAQDMGINIQKQWVAIHDAHTRMSHALIDGEIVGVDEEFSNGLMFPGDEEGAPEEVYNCRCTMMCVLGDYDFKGYDVTFDAEAYEEWKNEHG